MIIFDEVELGEDKITKNKALDKHSVLFNKGKTSDTIIYNKTASRKNLDFVDFMRKIYYEAKRGFKTYFGKRLAESDMMYEMVWINEQIHFKQIANTPSLKKTKKSYFVEKEENFLLVDFGKVFRGPPGSKSKRVKNNYLNQDKKYMIKQGDNERRRPPNSKRKINKSYTSVANRSVNKSFITTGRKKTDGNTTLLELKPLMGQMVKGFTTLTNVVSVMQQNLMQPVGFREQRYRSRPRVLY